jgi:hypothetical protein
MSKLGGVIGGVLGFLIVIVIGEWLWVDWFGTHGFLEGVLYVVFVAGGAFLGSAMSPRVRHRSG